MLSKTSIRWALVATFLVAILATPKPALAWGGCGSSYVAQSGDTLSSVAERCGVDVNDLRQANNVGEWIYAGQTLYMPGDYPDGGFQDGGYNGGGFYNGYQGGSSCYDYQTGSNCNGYQSSSNCFGYQAVGNCYADGGCYGSQYVGHAYGPNYGGASGSTYVVQSGDTMRIISDRLAISLCDLIAANPKISNPSLIYAGQVICLPAYDTQPSYYQAAQNWGYKSWGAKNKYVDQVPASNLYTVQAGEKLRDVARKFDTTQEELLILNPSLKDKPGNIYRGLVLQVR